MSQFTRPARPGRVFGGDRSIDSGAVEHNAEDRPGKGKGGSKNAHRFGKRTPLTWPCRFVKRYTDTCAFALRSIERRDEVEVAFVSVPAARIE